MSTLPTNRCHFRSIVVAWFVLLGVEVIDGSTKTTAAAGGGRGVGVGVGVGAGVGVGVE